MKVSLYYILKYKEYSNKMSQNQKNFRPMYSIGFTGEDSTIFRINSKLFASLAELLTPLEELDSLCELFSFFTPITTNYGRPTCRWWNDLLTKDEQVLNKIANNNDGNEALIELQKEVLKFRDQSLYLLKMEEKIRIMASKVSGKSIRCGKGKKRINQIEDNLIEIRDYNHSYHAPHSIDIIHIKQKGVLVVRYLNEKPIHLYVCDLETVIESDYIKDLTIVISDPRNLRINTLEKNKLPNLIGAEFFILDSKKIKFGDEELKEVTKFKSNTWYTYTNQFRDWLNVNSVIEGFDWIYYKNPNEPGRVAYVQGFTGYPGLDMLSAAGHVGYTAYNGGELTNVGRVDYLDEN
jgi:hypothetical protein